MRDVGAHVRRPVRHFRTPPRPRTADHTFGSMFASPQVTAPTDAVAMTLGPSYASLRSHVLTTIVPRLDAAMAEVAEEDELPHVLDTLAQDQSGLLDPRADGDLGVRAATVAVEALATG